MDFWFSKDPSISIPLVAYIGWFEEQLGDQGWVKYDETVVYKEDLILVTFNYDNIVRWICPSHLISNFKTILGTDLKQSPPETVKDLKLITSVTQHLI